jgi:hypothetical protein
MTAIHGKNAIIYLAPGTGVAVPLSEQNTYSIEADFDLAETTELGDGFKTFVKGEKSWKGKIDGNFDTASITLWSAFLSETVSNFYLYPDRSVAGSYYYGTVWVKPSTIIGGGTGDKSKGSVELTGDGVLSTH